PAAIRRIRYRSTPSIVVPGHLTVVGGLEEDPGPLADRVPDELDVPVAETSVYAPRVATPRLAGHVPVVCLRPAAHPVPRADAGVPERGASLDLVGVVEPVVRGRVPVPPGDHHARPREPEGPRPPRVLVADADADLVELERAARPVGDRRDGSPVVRAHHWPLGHPLVRRVVDRGVPADV